MLGWDRRAADWASRRKRSRSSGSSPMAAVIVLMATLRLRMGSRAL